MIMIASQGWSKGALVEKNCEKRRQNRIQSGGWGSGSRGRGVSRNAWPGGGGGGFALRYKLTHSSSYGSWKEVDSSKSQQDQVDSSKTGQDQANSSKTRQDQADWHTVVTYQVGCDKHHPQCQGGGEEKQDTRVAWRGQPWCAGYYAVKVPVDDVERQKEKPEMKLKTSGYGQWGKVESSQTKQEDYFGADGEQGHDDSMLTWRGQPGYAHYQTFTFESPVDVDRKEEIKEVELKNEGQIILSMNEANVPSEVTFKRNFITPEEADQIYETLVREINWNRRIKTRYDGSTYEEPRKTFFFGEHNPLSYASDIASSKTWHSVILDLRKQIEAETGHTFNCVLCNYYEDGKDGVQWHSDDEYSLGNLPVIASLSLGETRKFQLRKKPYPGAKDEEDYCDMEKYFIHLESGSLLVMKGATQEDWQHRVPKEYHDKKGRISLTFKTQYLEK